MKTGQIFTLDPLSQNLWRKLRQKFATNGHRRGKPQNALQSLLRTRNRWVFIEVYSIVNRCWEVTTVELLRSMLISSHQGTGLSSELSQHMHETLRGFDGASQVSTKGRARPCKRDFGVLRLLWGGAEAGRKWCFRAGTSDHNVPAEL